MKLRHSYIGKLNGVSGIWVDKKPKGIELDNTVDFYSPDEGKVFQKDGEYFASVVIKDGIDIKDYVEVSAPKEENKE